MDDRTIEQIKKNEDKLIKEIEELEQQVKKQQEVIDRVIEIIEPYVEWDMCTINGKILKMLFEILSEVSE